MLELIGQLERWLAEVTGYDAVSVQPNAGCQGELAGLLAIRAYHRDRGQGQRDVCLIPASAHGTNAASAAMAGMRVVMVACDPTAMWTWPIWTASSPSTVTGGGDHGDLPVHPRGV